MGRKKNFPVFDCDSHIYEPPEIWDKYIPQKQQEFAKTHFYRDADRLILVRNSKISFRNPDQWKYPEKPGSRTTKKIIGATQPGTKDWDEKIGRNASARDPHARLKEMDAAGIDQVTTFRHVRHLPLVDNADAAHICARAYNDWVYDHCSADPKRLYPAAVPPIQNVDYAIEELLRVAKRGSSPLLCVRSLPTTSIRPFRNSILCGGSLKNSASCWGRYASVAGRGDVPGLGNAWERTGNGCSRTKTLWFIHRGSLSPISCRSWAPASRRRGYGFIAEAMTWTGVVLMTGWLENFPVSKWRSSNRTRAGCR